MATLNQRIRKLEGELIQLKAKLRTLSVNTEEKPPTPYSKVGGIRDRSQIRPIDPTTGLGQHFGGSMAWNDSELKVPPLGQKPADPIEGYNKHTHSKFAGGALDIEHLELVQYDVSDWDGSEWNPHSQQFWASQPPIKKAQKENNENVDMIGLLSLVFDPETEKWGVTAYEIDVKKCYLVMRDEDGEIMRDENNNEMKAPLYNEDQTKTCIVWDKNAQCWRLYATYSEYTNP